MPAPPRDANRLRIAVITDCHAYVGRPEDKGNSPSWLDLGVDQSEAGKNPFAGLHELALQDPTVRADIVLCCGDLGDKANPAGLQYVWREVARLKETMEADLVIGTAGNHDMDSRHVYNDHDARNQIQALKPLFPVDNERHWLEYWAKNFTIITHGRVRIVILNTAAYHGYAKDPSKPEYAHGRVSDGTITRMVSELSAGGTFAANLLVCHHHPFRNSRIADLDYSEMSNGDQLVNRVVDAMVGPWLVIHGHKHTARVFYAFGSSAAPTVFAAASFAARAYPNQVGQTFNEFYILDLEIPPAPGATSSLKGRIRTWNWTFGNSWRRPQVGEGLGPSAGFGLRVDVAELAATVATSLQSAHSGATMKWDDVVARNPSLKHLIPEDFDLLIRHLTDFHAFGFTCEPERKEIAEVQVP